MSLNSRSRAPKRVAGSGGQRPRASIGGERDQETFAASAMFLKTKLCKFFAVGACSRGADCKFAHGQDSLSELPDFTKTQLCASVLLYGVCDAAGCTFAHSRAELRPRIDRPRIDKPSPPRPAEAAPAAPCSRGARPRHGVEQAARRQAEALGRPPHAVRVELRLGEELLMMHQGGGKSGGLGYPSTRSRQTSATSAADSHPRASSDDQSETAQWSRQISFADSHPDASSDDQSETTQFSRQTSPTAPQPWASADGQYGTGELGSGGQGDDVAGRPKRRLVVRNTFLTVVDDEEAPTLGRVKSAPTLALCPSMGLARTGAGVHVAPSSGRR